VTLGWQQVSVGEAADPVERLETPIPGISYRQIGVRLWGEGAYEREPVDGGSTKYRAQNRVETGDIIVNKIWARNGSVSVVFDGLGGCYCSGEFPLFSPRPDRLDPAWFYWITKTRWFWRSCDDQSRGTSGQNRIRPEKFAQIKIPLPPLAEQRRVVAKIGHLAAKIDEAQKSHLTIASDAQSMLLSEFFRLTADAPMRPMREVAPLVRRPVSVVMDAMYPELGIRSFGRGTFHKPELTGFEMGSKKLFEIHCGDLLFNIVFAWEGAVAVARSVDHGRFGSHRFLTCVPRQDATTAEFLRFYFLTEEGLERLGRASPGGAGRNRTLGLKPLERIKVPVPPIEQQLWFDSLQAKVDRLKALQAQTRAELEALLPSILDRAFKGEL